MLLGSPWTTNYGSLTAFNLLIGKNYASSDWYKKKKKRGNYLITAIITCSTVSSDDGKGNQGDGNPHTWFSLSQYTKRCKEASPELLKSDKLQLKKRHLNSNLLKIKLNTQ